MRVVHFQTEAGTAIDLIKAEIMATKSTQEHGKIIINAFIFSCSCVDSVAIK
jgi:hypothetical protein